MLLRLSSYRSLFLFLLALILGLPFLKSFVYGPLVAEVIFVGILVSAVSTLFGKGRSFYVAATLAVVASVSVLSSYFTSHRLPMLIALLASISLCVLVIYFLFRNLFEARSVTRDTIIGSICIYLLIGISFSQLFWLIEWLVPGSFVLIEGMTGGEGALGGVAVDHFRVGGFLYFSFVTLTTLGYGDVTPLSPFSQTACMLEAVIGQFYMAVMVARLVSLNLVYGQGGDVVEDSNCEKG